MGLEDVIYLQKLQAELLEAEEEARKELQKLRWLLSRTRKPGVPFPPLTDCCSCLLVLLEKENVGDDPPFVEEEVHLLVRKQEEEEKPGLRRRVARWAFKHGVRKQQKFFLERW